MRSEHTSQVKENFILSRWPPSSRVPHRVPVSGSGVFLYTRLLTGTLLDEVVSSSPSGFSTVREPLPITPGICFTYYWSRLHSTFKSQVISPLKHYIPAEELPFGFCLLSTLITSVINQILQHYVLDGRRETL